MKIIKPIVTGVALSVGVSACALIESEPKQTLPPTAAVEIDEIDLELDRPFDDTKNCIYEVKPEDDLLKIGNIYGLSITYLMAENSIKNMSNEIYVGDELDVCFDGINAFTGEPRAYTTYYPE
jgi:hypothetical protein